jgi:cytidylate kinase
MAIITISKTSFSGGEQLAEALATRLEYPILTREELILAAAEESGFPETKLVETMEEPPKLWQQDRDKRDAHFNLIAATFLKRCMGGNLVYHGFSGQELIRGVAHVMRVLVIADEAYRIKSAMEQLDVSRNQAMALIAKNDKKLASWTRHMYDFEWKNPYLYDAIYKIGRIHVASVVESVLEIVRCGDFEPNEASRLAFQDELLRSLVWSALTRDERTRSAQLEIVVRQGCVTITGAVRSEHQLEEISAVAGGVAGVRSIHNEVSVGTIWRA